MKQDVQGSRGCCGTEKASCTCDSGMGELLPLAPDTPADIPCCGPPPAPPAPPFERPGYAVCPFVEDFIETEAGRVPRVSTCPARRDMIGTIRVRLGIGRSDYKIAPGLWCVGNPGADSPVLVSASYKLSFDTLRRELTGLDAWILVLDTRGVNVWCAAGKGTFSTGEVIRQVNRTGLKKVVSHRQLILPQLSATGVSAHQVRKGCGFQVIWGPVRAADISDFIKAGMKADISMRRVTFSFWERTVLIPVEISLLMKPVLRTLLAVFLLSGLGPGVFSLHGAWTRGGSAALAIFAGVLAGAVMMPMLLPLLPGRAFALKGALTGLFVGLLTGGMAWEQVGFSGAAGLMLFTIATSSYLAMNFTGSTPFTSPSGVEKEMRKAIPLQALTVLVSAVFWVGSAFSG